MYYWHRLGPVMRLLSLPVTRPTVSTGFGLANRLIGRFGNKLTVQGLRQPGA